jgi:DnaJ like chaperone protein
MSNIFNYLWLILIAIYIISPVDLVPWHIFDDLIAAGVMFYMLYKNARGKKQYQQYYSHFRNQSQDSHKTSHESGGPLTLDRAYALLGVTASASWDEINRAYRDKISKSHPDKVSHLSEELQQKAEELTLRLNEALALVKRHKGRG